MGTNRVPSSPSFGESSVAGILVRGFVIIFKGRTPCGQVDGAVHAKSISRRGGLGEAGVAWDAYLEFPELKQRVKLEYTEKWKPDLLLIENRGSGQPLIQELRNAGIMCTEFTPTRGKASQKTPDKIVRVNSITDMFSSGIIYRPNKRWAEKVMHQFAEFPNGDHDDYVDSGTQALMRFRQGGFVRLESDDQDDDEEFYSSRRKRRKYY